MKKSLRILTLSLCLVFALGACPLFSRSAVPDRATAERESSFLNTENYLVENGVSEYVIVYPENTQTSLINTAVSELTLFFEQATGVSLPVRSDAEDEIYWRKSAKYISLGETQILTASGAGKDVDRAALKATGYAIRNAGKSVFLIGGRENGVVNAVYRFLKEQFSFECYAPDEICLDQGVRTEKLLDYGSLSVTPDVTFYAAAQTETMLNQTYARRLGMSQLADWILELGGAFTHNWFGTIPPADYSEEHPLWFSPNGKQLCLSRDPEGLSDEVLKKVQQVLLKNPTGYCLPFCQMDDGGWCTCETCAEYAKRYGANSAVMILFMNMLWEKTENWLKVNMPEREVYYYIFAYQNSTEPPKTDENGNLPPEMILNDHTYVQYAPIYAAGYQSYDYKNPGASDNSYYDSVFTGWQKVTDKIMAWTYSFYYKGSNGIYPYFDFANLKETYSYLANHGVDYLFDEDRSGGAMKMSDWSRLRFYIRAKLAWDKDADLISYADAFFANYYKYAAQTMRKLFDEYTTYYAMLVNDNRLRGQGGDIDILEPSFWPKGVLDRWMRMFDKALSEIAFLKETDPDLYKTLEERIRLDSISLRYLCISLYGEESCVYVGNGNTVAEDAKEFGISYIG